MKSRRVISAKVIERVSRERFPKKVLLWVAWEVVRSGEIPSKVAGCYKRRKFPKILDKVTEIQKDIKRIVE